ncbi:MAG: zinc ribbon domain-containing protein [Nitrospirota bacterium]
MFCTSCGVKLPDEARFCSSCGSRVASATSSGVEQSGDPNQSPAPPSVSPNQTTPEILVAEDLPCPRADLEFRKKLLESYLKWQTSQELSNWLQVIGQDSRGSVEEKKTRIREHTQYLSMSPETFPEQTVNYLRLLNRTDILSDICVALGLDSDGSKSTLFRRIYREVGYREGWFTPIKDRSAIDKLTVLQFVRWYPIIRWSDYERDYYDDFADEMIEVFGEDNVHEQVPVAHGSILKIDFHIGHPQNGGVGVEFKLPANNNELQRALGQIDQYLSRYGSNIILVLIPHRLRSTEGVLFKETLRRKGIETVMKTPDFSSIAAQRAA